MDDEAPVTTPYFTVTRGHLYGRDCWCNPLVVTAGMPLVMPGSGTVMRMDPISANQMALHFEPQE